MDKFFIYLAKNLYILVEKFYISKYHILLAF